MANHLTQDVFDSSTTNEGDYFDELALFTYPDDPTAGTIPEEVINSSKMLTHVIFHCTKKCKQNYRNPPIIRG